MMRVDTLPIALSDRALGRLQKASPDDDIGLLSAFVRQADAAFCPKGRDSHWYTQGREARPNRHVSWDLLANIGRLFDAHARLWFDNPRR